MYMYMYIHVYYIDQQLKKLGRSDMYTMRVYTKHSGIIHKPCECCYCYVYTYLNDMGQCSKSSVSVMSYVASLISSVIQM